MESGQWAAWMQTTREVYFSPQDEMIMENHHLQWPMHITASRECFLRMEAPPLEPVVDMESARRARRIIRNRESAARSRERKQAYTEQLKREIEQLKELNSSLEKRLAVIKKLDDDYAASLASERKRRRSLSVEF